ncbi:uncharacterized protein LOC119985314 [Tripterygium wilfordii]|uniref:uncharacterized protein LOC119985314 n=1 Tax=Tripterygium wilfordii TaxID=458696 RepID=UPI0018F7FB44|nr:uncharacterized protein LOC119985314 [Tripterygium wilfordii]XP_038685502.1 uncharacterized protein LOC119985314 [Tripterygium wilfordii]XP_038685503.1 uncharacterized protein LOC119985314 [Tripterygium wilfordii]
MGSPELSKWDPFDLIGEEGRGSEDIIMLSIHPHKLIFSEEMKNDGEILCRWCLDPVKDATYNCKDCSFSLHKSCADVVRGWRYHWWTSFNKNEDGCNNCCICGEIVSDSHPSYVCRICNMVLHKSCVSDLPREFKHVVHREHPLFLLSNCKRYGTCDRNGAFVYYCEYCTFTLDIKRALQRQPLCLQEPENHKHEFIPLMRSEYSFPCDACGFITRNFGSSSESFLCTICQIIVHDDCISLPHTIKIFHHDHPLTNTFFFLLKDEDIPPVDQLNCRICRTKFDKDFGGYYCVDCQFVTHVGCALENQISTNNSIVNAQEAIVDSVREIELTEDEFPLQIKHFSHEHKLSLSDEMEDKCCAGCIRPISHPFYRCVECGFFLHKTCIDLPNQIRPVFHDHPLTLLPSAPRDNWTFQCSLCHTYCHGFVYACEECKNFYADVRCASIPLNIRHPGHDHKLSFTRIPSYNGRYCYSVVPTLTIYFNAISVHLT